MENHNPPKRFGSRRKSYQKRPVEPFEGSKGRDFTQEHGYNGSGKISAVEVQKTNAERVNVFIEGDYAFSLALIVAAGERIKPGIELSVDRVAELQAKDLYNLALSAALEFLAARPRSEAEVKLRLKRRYPAASAETINQVVERLKELKYLNDADFAKYWIENRSAFAPRGRHLLKQELMQKGVHRDIVEAALEIYLETASEQAEDVNGEEAGISVEESQALQIARKKARSYAAEDWPGFYRKLGGFLLRRGYDYSLASRVTRQIWKEIKGQQPSDFE